MHLFSEVTDDGIQLSGFSVPSNLLLSIAPMTLTPFLVSILVGTLYWRESARAEPTFFQLTALGILTAFGLTALAVAGEVYRQYSHLDGGREPTVSMWFSNLFIISFLALANYWAWKPERTPS